MDNDKIDNTPKSAPRMSEIMEQLNASGEAEWDPQLSAVIRWKGHGYYDGLAEPFQRSLTARVADLFHPHGLIAYLAGRGYRRVAKQEMYEIWEVTRQEGGFELVTVPTDTENGAFDLAWEDAVSQIAAAEQWYVDVNVLVMIPEALREACSTPPAEETQA